MAADEVSIVITPTGGMRFIYSDDLIDLIEGATAASIVRASHVEPSDGGWTADLCPVGGEVLGPFHTRAEALDAEVAWLRKERQL